MSTSNILIDYHFICHHLYHNSLNSLHIFSLQLVDFLLGFIQYPDFNSQCLLYHEFEGRVFIYQAYWASICNEPTMACIYIYIYILDFRAHLMMDVCLPFALHDGTPPHLLSLSLVLLTILSLPHFTFSLLSITSPLTSSFLQHSYYKYPI